MSQKLPLIAVLVFAALSCKKGKTEDPIDLPNGIFGLVKAKKNGGIWVGANHSERDPENPGHWRLFFSVYCYNEPLGTPLEYRLSDALTFRNIPATIGKYAVKNHEYMNFVDPSVEFFTHEHDMIYRNYNIIEGEPNYISIDSYDLLSREIKGRFELTMTLEPHFHSYLPDTFRLRKGTFHTRLEE